MKLDYLYKIKIRKKIKISISKGGNMDYKKFVEDLHAMTMFLGDQDMSSSEILFNVVHDLSGVVYEKPCFLPRCTGYSDKMEEEEE